MAVPGVVKPGLPPAVSAAVPISREQLELISERKNAAVIKPPAVSVPAAVPITQEEIAQAFAPRKPDPVDPVQTVVDAAISKTPIVTDTVLEKYRKEQKEAQTQQDMGLFKSITNRMIDNVTEKTLAKSNLTEEKKQKFRDAFAESRSGVFDDHLNKLDKQADVVIKAGALAATAVTGVPVIGIVSGLESQLQNKTTGPLSVTPPTDGNTPGGALKALRASEDGGSKMPGWLVPLILVGLLLLSGGKKLLRI